MKNAIHRGQPGVECTLFLTDSIYMFLVVSVRSSNSCQLGSLVDFTLPGKMKDKQKPGHRGILNCVLKKKAHSFPDDEEK